MARENFPASLAEILKQEGGYVDHPKDPGGATNLGITIATLRAWRKPDLVSKQDVRELTRDGASAIYRALYWNKVSGDDLPAGFDLATFDPAVTSGAMRGAKWMQRALGVPADGRIGPITVRAAASAKPVRIIAKASTIRMGFLRGLGTWTTFGRGWSARVARVEAVAVRMALVSAGAPARPVLIDMHAAAQAGARKETAAAGGAAAGGGAITLADIPEWALIAALVVLALIVVNQIGRARHQRARAEAMRQVAEEARA